MTIYYEYGKFSTQINIYWFVSYLVVDHIYFGIVQCGDIAALLKSVTVLQFVRSTCKAIKIILSLLNTRLTLALFYFFNKEKEKIVLTEPVLFSLIKNILYKLLCTVILK